MSILSPSVMKSLGDRSYEKRKHAALEIDTIVKDLQSSALSTAPSGSPPPLHPQILSLISLLTRDFAYSTLSNHRKGGLIGIAATAIALMENANMYLSVLLPPVLKGFTDVESRVRYYATEALYNITKVSRGSVLLFFNEIFDGLCKLYSDVDPDVKNGAQLLDRLMKDVVTESTMFDVGKFIPLLGERIKIKNPHIRQLIVGWISVLDSVPDIDMLEYIPEYLGGLIDMLSDPNKDIRQQSYAVLSELLREITVTIQGLQSATSPSISPSASGSTTGSINISALIVILVNACSESRDNFTKLTVLTWMNEILIIASPTTLIPFVADMLGVALHCISDSEKEIRQKSERTNDMLLQLASSTNPSAHLIPLLEKLTHQLHNKWVPTRLASLRWISMLLSRLPGSLQPFLVELFPILLHTLQDPDDFVVQLDLEVLARVCLDARGQIDPPAFAAVLGRILLLFRDDRRFLEIRGSFIVRGMCELLDAEQIYRKWSSILAGDAVATNIVSFDLSSPPLALISIDDDCDFCSLMVQTLNLILLTSCELAPLRNRLKHCLQGQAANANVSVSACAASSTITDSAGLSLFQSLYASWVHNPISTFSLCLLTSTYYLASELIVLISRVDITVAYLMQMDKLIQLLESPIFIHLRLQLLEEPNERNNIMYLLKALYGILMLLPQSTAFTSLKTRLESVTPMVMMMKGVHEVKERKSKEDDSGSSSLSALSLSSSSSSLPSPASSSLISLESSLPISSLLQHFQHVQSRHSHRRHRMTKTSSIIRPIVAAPTEGTHE